MRKGKDFEDMACEYLESLGYYIIRRNFHCQGGEIDILAMDQDTLVFVEVKGKRCKGYSDPAERIDRIKKGRLLRCIGAYLSEYPTEKLRVDAILIREKDIEHIKGIELDSL
ncbi:MAG: YraN family protein [Aquificaceae bacterium]